MSDSERKDENILINEKETLEQTLNSEPVQAGDFPSHINNQLGRDNLEIGNKPTINKIIFIEAGGIIRRIQQLRNLIREKHSIVEILAREEQLKIKFSEFKKEKNNITHESDLEKFQEVEFLVEDLCVEIKIYISDHEGKHDNTFHAENPDPEKETALWKGLKKVTLPIFSGNKSQYENWAAAFEAIIDKAPISAEHKMLHLKSYLSGEAAEVIKNLGHSASAYEVAKERLGRRYGGARRRNALLLEQIENFPIIKPNSASDLAKFADILDVLSVNLSESGMTTELGAGLLYIKLQKKLPKSKLATYHRWLFEKKLEGSVMHLRTWILQEQVFDTIAEETSRGLLNSDSNNSFNSFHLNKANNSKSKCKLCGELHSLRDCPIFQDMSLEERSEKALRMKICFLCLNEGHYKRDCKAKITCDTCGKSHNTLFHGRTNPTKTFHLGSIDTTRISLRTIPIKLWHNGKELPTNAILDDGSTCSFINAETAHLLGIPKGPPQPLSVGCN